MATNHSGKTISIILIIVSILFVTSMAASVYVIYQKDEEKRMLELVVEKNRTDLARLDNDNKDLKKSKFLLEEKNKEADDRINSLMDELELQKGLSEEIKTESAKLKEQLAKEIQDKEALQKTIGGFSNPEDISQLKTKLDAEMNLRAEAEQQVTELQQKLVSVEQQAGKNFEAAKKEVSPEVEQAKKQVDLEKVVVATKDIPEGRVLSVDADTEFLIVNLGSKDGLTPGLIMSIYRGQEYLGDVKVTRVQPEMSAADFIPPFSSRKVRKNDQVVFNQQ
jgi:hypothetical protein